MSGEEALRAQSLLTAHVPYAVTRSSMAHTPSHESAPDDANRPSESLDASEEPRQPWWSMQLPLFGVLALFAITVVFVPTSWIDKLQDLLGANPVNVEATFQASTARVDVALRTNPSDVDADKVRSLRHAILLRRLLRTGPMTGPEVREAKEMLIGFDQQMATETSPDSRRALRHAHARRLHEAFPRLRGERIRDVLDTFAAQYSEATGEEL